MNKYPEWNYENKDYTEQATVEPKEFIKKDLKAYNKFEQQFGSLSTILSNSIGKLKSDQKAIERRTRAGRINQRYVAQEIIRLYAGREPDERIHDRKINVYREQLKTNAGIGILLDQSGSTRHGVDHFNRRIDLIKSAALIIGRTLDTVGENFFVYSFHTHADTNPTIIESLKETSEPWNHNIEQRISAIEETSGTDYYNNKDGAAIRYANERLSELLQKTKYLFMVTDGNPNCDCKYYCDHYAQEDTKKAMEEGTQKGIKYIYLTINPESSADRFLDLINPVTAFCKRYTKMQDIVEGLTTVYEAIKRGRYN